MNSCLTTLFRSFVSFVFSHDGLMKCVSDSWSYVSWLMVHHTERTCQTLSAGIHDHFLAGHRIHRDLKENKAFKFACFCPNSLLIYVSKLNQNRRFWRFFLSEKEMGKAVFWLRDLLDRQPTGSPSRARLFFAVWQNLLSAWCESLGKFCVSGNKTARFISKATLLIFA